MWQNIKIQHIPIENKPTGNPHYGKIILSKSVKLNNGFGFNLENENNESTW